MYCISDTQIDYILNDISARGVGMVSLQQDLLDHICCVIEHNLEDDGDFERFYERTIATFYQSELKEIETETINLLTHKNYYVMKKIMLASGAFSVATLTLGIFFKFMHWPGASVCILLGILSLSFVFLPLMFTLKAKEQQSKNDRIIAAIGTLSAILISVGILFKIMHWPGANVMCSLALGIMLAVFLPVYFFSGVRNPQTKTNTIVSSVLLFAGCALILTLIRSPHGTKNEYAKNTDYFLRNEQMVQNEQRLLSQMKSDTAVSDDGNKISRLCDELKSFLLQKETGSDKIDPDFESKGIMIGDTYADDYLAHAPDQDRKLKQLQQAIKGYNEKHSGVSGFQPISVRNSIFDDPGRVRTALNDLIQIQMAVLQNQRGLIASR
jgi:hypothetical protein